MNGGCRGANQNRTRAAITRQAPAPHQELEDTIKALQSRAERLQNLAERTHTEVEKLEKRALTLEHTAHDVRAQASQDKRKKTGKAKR